MQQTNVQQKQKNYIDFILHTSNSSKSHTAPINQSTLITQQFLPLPQDIKNMGKLNHDDNPPTYPLPPPHGPNIPVPNNEQVCEQNDKQPSGLNNNNNNTTYPSLQNQQFTSQIEVCWDWICLNAHMNLHSTKTPLTSLTEQRQQLPKNTTPFLLQFAGDTTTNNSPSPRERESPKLLSSMLRILLVSRNHVVQEHYIAGTSNGFVVWMMRVLIDP